MAPESRTENPGVTLPSASAESFAEVRNDMRQHPGRFEFFQAVRMLLRIFGDREVPGSATSVNREAVRFRVNNSLAFPPSQISSIDWDGAVPAMAVNFMGVTGPMGVLPRVYSEFVISRLRARDRTLADFFDIFNHRMISLFYQAWEKYRSAVAYERDGEDRLSKYLMCLIGLGTDGLQNRMEVNDDSLLFYSGLLSLQPRSAAALRGALQDYFGVPVEVEQFVGAWQPLGSSRSVRPWQRLLFRFAAWRGQCGGRRNLESAVADPPENGPVDARAVFGIFTRRGRQSTLARPGAVLLRHPPGDRGSAHPEARGSAALRFGRR